MKYLLETPHTKDECIKELDEVLSEGYDVLDKFYWGCSVGDHTGYAIVDADNDLEVRNMVPDFIRNKAKIVELHKFSPDDIRSFHH